MINLTRSLSDRMACTSSRRGLLVMVGRATVVASGIIAGFQTGKTEAMGGECGQGCGSPPCPACSPATCTPGQSEVFVGCCQHGTHCYQTYECVGLGQNCYLTFATVCGCPQ